MLARSVICHVIAPYLYFLTCCRLSFSFDFCGFTFPFFRVILALLFRVFLSPFPHILCACGSGLWCHCHFIPHFLHYTQKTVKASFVFLTFYTYIISYLRFYQCLQGLKNLTEITFIISDRNRPIKKAVAFQLAALWSVVSGLIFAYKHYHSIICV